jgi:cell division septation protein DedD
MASSASPSRLFPARSRKSYRLEMESRTLYLLLSLMALTGVVIFYLGVVTGKALRDPNAPVALTAQMGAPAGKDGAAQPDKLAFSEALKGDQKGVEGLKVEGQTASQRTDALLSEAQKQLELKEVNPAAPPKAPTPATASAPKAPTPASASVPQVAATAPAPPPARAAAPSVGRPTPPRTAAAAAPHVASPATPSAPSVAASNGELYTVQVFSSQHQDTARQLMEHLRAQGFAAYLNRFESADRQVWYRVRVGKTDRASAETLQGRLKSEAKLKNPVVQKL